MTVLRRCLPGGDGRRSRSCPSGLRAEVLDRLSEDVSDLSDLHHELAVDGQLSDYAATERFYEIGTPDALARTGEFLAREISH
jgi:hypothetical protein